MRGWRAQGIREAVVTGCGAVGSCGAGLEPLAAALAGGRPRTSAIDREPGVPPRRGSARTAARIVDRGWGDWISSRESRRMSPPSVWAVVAGRMALAAAGLALPEEPDPDVGVILATAFGPSSTTQRMLDQILEEGPAAISPFLFMESVANAPAGQTAIHCRASGPNLTVCQREAGPLIAVARAATEISLGRARAVLAGASEEMTPLLHSVLDRFGALSDDPRPFGRRRDGLLAAEGATVLHLEAAPAARRRGARILARVPAWGGTFDPTAPAADWGRGANAVVRRMRRQLGDAGLLDAGGRPAGRIAVISGASGARRGDALEAAVLRGLFGESLPPVLTPKAVTGEYGGAQLAAALLALAGRPVAPPEGIEPDPELGVVPHTGCLDPAPERVLVTTQAAGGTGAWVVLDAG